VCGEPWGEVWSGGGECKGISGLRAPAGACPARSPLEDEGFSRGAGAFLFLRVSRAPQEVTAEPPGVQNFRRQWFVRRPGDDAGGELEVDVRRGGRFHGRAARRRSNIPCGAYLSHNDFSSSRVTASG
jgi:hypothetical protein